jgi:isopenicillin N synthase-like dioxygenase
MSLENSSGRAEKMDKLLKEIDEMPDDGTAMGVSHKIQKMLKAVMEIYEQDFLEHIDADKARENKPAKGYVPIAFELDKMATMFDRFAKFISNFDTNLNVGKVFNPSLETDTGIYLGLENLTSALKEAANSFRRDAETLRKI